jgi:uncharacterized protein YbjT (DUF2867 family)
MYVIAGVTGHTGKVAADTLLAQGEKVRVIVRKREQGAPWLAKGAEVAVASLDDASALAAAFAGAQGAYVLVPPRYDVNDMLAAQVPVIDALAESIRKSAIPHVVLLSSVGAELAEGTGPIRTLHRAERVLGQASKNITFLRAAYFIENHASVLAATAGGVLPTFLNAEQKISMIATADIGRTVAELLLEPATGPRVVELTGRETWSPNDVAATLTQLLGRPVQAQFAPAEFIVPALTSTGMPQGVAELFREMIGGINSGAIRAHGTHVVRRFGTLTPADVLPALLQQPAATH